MPVDGDRPRRWRSPADSVPDDELHIGVVVGGVLLVARAEVEDPTPPSPVAEPAPEDLPPAEPAHEDELVRLGHVEGLPVHLLFEFYKLAEPFCYWMARRNHPEALRVVVAPLEVAGRPHQLLEDLR